MKPLLLLPLLAVLAGCADNSVRYVAPPAAPPAAPVALAYRSIEVRDVVLPDYAEAPEMLIEEPGGGLARVKGAVWGDGSARAVTAALVASLAARSTASVAAEPWPLSDPPAARLHVRIHRMLASDAGTYVLDGQYAVESLSGREFIRPFSVSVPLAGTAPSAIAAAKGAAMQQLAAQVVAELGGRS